MANEDYYATLGVSKSATEDEIKKVLGKEKGEEFCHAYQIEPSGIPNRIGQPWTKTTNRMPGPSTVPILSREWILPLVTR